MRSARLAMSLLALAGGIELVLACVSYVVLPMDDVTGPPTPGTGIEFGSAMFAYLVLLAWGTVNAAVLVLSAVYGLAVHRDAARWRRAQRRVLLACLIGALICVAGALAGYRGTTAIPPESVGPSLIHVIVYSGIAFFVMLCLLAHDRVHDRAGGLAVEPGAGGRG
ncbi:hypothetical protein [Actinocorallia herbida]|uniref:hypothetical protein n=1 Tax=Actinocorallia herbida TaxID=58109 RepID=UPI0011CD7725|nr:hypothetical protein [Actinocorallia herbida]